LRVQ